MSHTPPIQDLEPPMMTRKKSRFQEERDPNLVDWEETDAENPRNFSTGYKYWVTFQLVCQFGLEYYISGKQHHRSVFRCQ